MSLNEFEERLVKEKMAKFLQKRRPPVNIRDQVDLQYRIKDQSVTIFELRPRWNTPEIIESPIAKTTYIRSQNIWQVYNMGRDLKWHVYANLDSFYGFLKAVDEDENSCFWG
jgi:hypothetical protein